MGVLRAGFNGTVGQSSAQVIDGSLKFDSTSSNYLNRTPSSASNRKTWTWSAWVKRSDLGSFQYLFDADSGSNPEESTIRFWTDDRLNISAYTTSLQYSLTTTAKFRDPSAWYHIVVAFDTTNATADDRIKLYINGAQITQFDVRSNPSQNTDYYINSTIEHTIGQASSGNFRYFDGYLTNIQLIDGLALGPGYFGFTDPLTNTWRPKKFKAEGTTVNDGTVWSSKVTGANNPANAFDGSLSSNMDNNGSAGTPIVLTASFTNVTSFRYYTSNSSAHDVSFSGGSVTTDAASAGWRTVSAPSSITSISWIHSNEPGAYVVIEAIEINGEILRNSTTTNLAFGTNGFYLPMDNDDFNIDKSGKGNNWTKQNFSGTFNDPDVLKDSPSGAVSGGRAQTGITTTSSAPSNYATMNPLQMSLNRTPTISDGNLSISLSSGSSEWTNTGCTMSIGSGKYYWEVQFTTINGTIARAGVADSDDYEFNRNTASSGLPWLGSGTGKSWSLDVGGNTYHNGSTVNASYTSTIITSDIIGVLLDLDNNTLSYSKNGTNLGVAHSNVTSDFVTPAFSLHGATTNTINVNFGQKPFKYAPTQGFLPLNSASATPETVITHPDQYVAATLYSGNNGTTQVTTGFQPDFVWLKGRSETLQHRLVDSVRGQHQLYSNSTAVEGDWDKLDILSNGFNVTNDGNEQNKSGTTYVAWTWKAGGNKNTFNVDDVGYASAAAAGLTGGTIALTGASVGTKQGFSITTFTTPGSGTFTYSHGLTQPPNFIITKATNQSYTWTTYHVSAGATKYLVLNTTAAAAPGTMWNNTTPSSSVVYGNSSNFGTSTNYVTYQWHDVPGLQKFGSYVANGNADGPYVELGFRPALVWIKSSSFSNAYTNWDINDSVRDTYNPADATLAANISDAENTDSSGNIGTQKIDLLSNGFKIRQEPTSSSKNTSGQTYIYCAWAEAPTFNLYGGQSNAR